MSKKLIAVAAAATLALTGLVGVAPATSMPFSGTELGAGNSLAVTAGAIRTGGAGTLASPYTVNVPSSGLATSGSTVRFVLSATASRAFTVSATSGIRLLAAVTNTTPVVLTGADTLSGTTNASGSAEWFAYPTSTTRGVVTLNFDGDITQVYITGNRGAPYHITSVTLPTFELSKAAAVVAVVTDAFGNAIDSYVAAESLTVTRVGTGATVAATPIQYSDTSKRMEGTVTPGATAGQLAISAEIVGLTATAAQKAAFGDPKSTFFGIANVAAAQSVAALQAQITQLQTQLAALTASTVTKAKYNKLVRKWNRANPNNKVKRVS